MGIKLKEHVDYDVENWISEEEAEKILIEAGYEKVEEWTKEQEK